MPFGKIKFFKGFTIVELLVTFVVIAIIFSFVFVEIQPARAKTRDARRISDLNTLKASLQLYYMDKGVYPISPTSTGWCSLETFPGVEDCAQFVINFTENLKPYLDQMPKDPLYPKEENGKKYSYLYRSLSFGLEYKIHADLETKEPYEVYSTGGLVIDSGTPGEEEENYPPQLYTYLAVPIEEEMEQPQKKFRLQGDILELGSSGSAVERGFEWGTSEQEPYPDSWTETGEFEIGYFKKEQAFPISPPGICIYYYYRAKALDQEGGWGYGNVMHVGDVCSSPPPPS